MPRHKILLLSGDILLIIASFYLAPMLRFWIYLDPGSIFDLSDVIAILMYPLVFYIFDFYNFEKRSGRTEFILRFAFAVTIIHFINSSLFYIFRIRPYSTALLGISGLLAFVFLTIWRLSFHHFMDPATPLKVVILGAGKTGQSLYAYLSSRNDYKVIGFVDDAFGIDVSVVAGAPVLGSSSHLSSLVQKNSVNQVIVAIFRSDKAGGIPHPG